MMDTLLPCQFCRSTFHCQQDLRCHQVNEHGEILLKMDEESHRLSLGIKAEKISDYSVENSQGSLLDASAHGPHETLVATALENNLTIIKTEKLDRIEPHNTDEKSPIASKLISKISEAKKALEVMLPSMLLLK